jgi:lysozyme family protein
MSAFDDVLRRVYAYEGKYDNDPADAGGETFRGISRRYAPRWPGWAIIDKVKKAGGSVLALVDPDLEKLADAFYREKWDRLRLGELTSGALACKIYQQHVLMGESWTIQRVQESVNLYCGKSIAVDGLIGDGTIRAINEAESMGKSLYIIRSITTAQLAYHESRVKSKPDQLRFLCGWSNRAWGD